MIENGVMCKKDKNKEWSFVKCSVVVGWVWDVHGWERGMAYQSSADGRDRARAKAVLRL